MAITEHSEPWDEDSIMALYRAYQETRDGVDYRHYRSILLTAREKSSAAQAEAEMEKRISVIRKEASRLYPMASSDRVERLTAEGLQTSSNALKNWKDNFLTQVSDFFDSISPARLVPVAVTIAVLAAITPFILDTGSSSGSIVSEQLVLLDSYSKQTAEELEGLGEYLHGFSAFTRSGDAVGGNRYAQAFSSGVVLVDIQAIDARENEAQLSAMIDSISSAPLVKESLANRSASLAERVTNAHNALQQHYENDQYQPVFLLGQWVESAYLLSRVALINSDSDVMVTALDNLPQLAEILEASGYLSPRLKKDFARLEPFRGRGDLSREAVSKTSSILLKLRTLGPQTQG